MIIKVGIVDKDEGYVTRLKDSLNHKYDEIEIFSFPKLTKALKAAKELHFQLLLLDDLSVSEDELNKNKNLIPKQCKIIFLSQSENNLESEDEVSTICKYKSISSWHDFICRFCKCEELLIGGGKDFSQSAGGKVCLFLGGSKEIDSSAAATMFCHFLKRSGRTVVALEPSAMPGEQLARMAEIIDKDFRVEYLLFTLHPESIEEIIPIYLNSNKLVLLTDGGSDANKGINKIIKNLSEVLCIGTDDIYKKCLLLYIQFDPKKGRLLENEEIGKLGGIDLNGSTDVPFEKLVTMLDV